MTNKTYDIIYNNINNKLCGHNIDYFLLFITFIILNLVIIIRNENKLDLNGGKIIYQNINCI